MQAEIHPNYAEITVTCSCGSKFTVGSTLGHDLSIDVCDKCHPFYTGQQKIVDTTGRVERFKQRYAMSGMTDKAKTDKE
ncbi:MAG: 50S ribosomal protein L31 [Pseudomonadota bacterium]|mgnify:FL=1